MIKVIKDFEAIPRHLTQKSPQRQTLAAIAAQDGSMYIRNTEFQPIINRSFQIFVQTQIP